MTVSSLDDCSIKSPHTRVREPSQLYYLPMEVPQTAPQIKVFEWSQFTQAAVSHQADSNQVMYMHTWTNNLTC